MSDVVLVAIISGVCAIIGSAVGTFSGMSASIKQLIFRMDALEKKQDKHNAVIERTYRLEQHNAVQDEEIKVANHRIEDLERKVG